jgi:fumarate hydratase, class I
LEEKVLELTRTLGIGAQFGGKYFCHDVRVVRLPRHGASLPIAIAVSCSADRQVKAKITRDGVFIEELERDPAHFLPETTDEHLDDDVVAINLNQPMDAIRAELSKHPVKTRVSLTGTIVVARDLAHAKIKEAIDKGEAMRNTSRITLFIMRAQPRRQKDMHQVHLDQQLPVAWIPTWITSKKRAAHLSC